MIKHLHCPEDGTVVDLRSMGVGVGTWLAGGHDGGWVVSSTMGSFRVANLFSGAEVMLAEKQVRVICEGCRHAPRKVYALKIVFSEPPTSDSCILAAMTLKCGVALCRVGCADGGWTVQGCPRESLVDIAFCNGELYGLHYEGPPVKFDIGVNEDGAPMITGEHRLAMQRVNRTHHTDHYHYMDYAGCYIFDLHGKLAMAAIYRCLPNHKPFFKVFKLVDIRIGGSEAHCEHKWLEVTSLGEHALFLGYQFSKAIHVPTNMQGGVERNCIYYSHRCRLGSYGVIPSDKVFLTISNDIPEQTYYKEEDTRKDVAVADLMRIRSVGYFKKGDLQGGMWILPPHI
ncbi:hypothetical protein ACQJBY_035728 [Aegilops geniculata]